MENYVFIHERSIKIMFHIAFSILYLFFIFFNIFTDLSFLLWKILKIEYEKRCFGFPIDFRKNGFSFTRFNKLCFSFHSYKIAVFSFFFIFRVQFSSQLLRKNWMKNNENCWLKIEENFLFNPFFFLVNQRFFKIS